MSKIPQHQRNPFTLFCSFSHLYSEGAQYVLFFVGRESVLTISSPFGVARPRSAADVPLQDRSGEIGDDEIRSRQ